MSGLRSNPCIAIVGAGFSGTMVAVHLLREARQPLRVVLIERAETAGVGVAYREQTDRHLLNVRAEGMSALPDQPAHFVKWLAALRGDDCLVNPAGFMPRRLYGQYLRSLLSEAAANSQACVRLDLVHDEVLGMNVNAANGNLHLRLASGSQIEAEQLVLATGNPGPADPAVVDRSFYGSSMYQANAWATQGLMSLRHDDDVMLIGSGLTALDWIASLEERGHRGRIHVVSRRGLLPQEHRAATSHRLNFDIDTFPATVRGLTRQVRIEVRKVTESGGDWRSVMDALRPHGQQLWKRLPPAERRRFLRHVRSCWDIHRHRAAPRNLEVVRKLAERGQLELIAGRPTVFHELPGMVEVSLRLRATGDTAVRAVQRVVNCTGPDSNFRRYNHPLMQSLREQGLAVVDDDCLGIETDADGRLRDADGRPSNCLYTLGPLRKGALWESTAVPEIRVQAQALAQRLLASNTATTGDCSKDWKPRLNVDAGRHAAAG